MIINQIAFRHLLGKNEEIKYVAHSHVFIIYPKLFKILLFGLLAPIIAYLLFPPFIYLWIVWFVFGALLFKYRVVQWYLDAWIVTNIGVIDQNWNSFFDKSTTRIELDNIEGITNEVKGFWGTVLRYGNTQIEHMSGQAVTLENVSNPRKLERTMLIHQQAYVRRQNFEDQSKLQDLLVDLLRTSGKKG